MRLSHAISRANIFKSSSYVTASQLLCLHCYFHSCRALITTGPDAGRYTNIRDDGGTLDIVFKESCCRNSTSCRRYTRKRPITPNATDCSTRGKPT